MRREVKIFTGQAQGTFNDRLAEGAKQVKFFGEVWVQVPNGTTEANALRRILGFRGSRPDPSQLGIYRSVNVTIFDESGTILFKGALVP